MAKNKSLISLLQRHRVNIARVIWVLLFAYVFGFERIAVHPLDSMIGLAGIGVIALGIVVRSLSAGMLRKNETLATGGMYAMVRNPLYFGSLLLLVGLNIIVADPLTMAVSAALFAITYIPTILREEKGLAYAYGKEWEAFKNSTPRLIPNPLRIGELRKGRWSARQWLKNHEHNTILAAIAILILLHLYGSYLAA